MIELRIVKSVNDEYIGKSVVLVDEMSLLSVISRSVPPCHPRSTDHQTRRPAVEATGNFWDRQPIRGGDLQTSILHIPNYTTSESIPFSCIIPSRVLNCFFHPHIIHHAARIDFQSGALRLRCQQIRSSYQDCPAA